jgi:hypothetical protein
MPNFAIAWAIVILQLLLFAVPIVFLVWLIRMIQQIVSSLQSVAARLASIEGAIRDASARRAS